MSETANKDIRELIKKKRLYQYEIAEALGVSEYTFCAWLRKDLKPERREKILKAINDYQI